MNMNFSLMVAAVAAVAPIAGNAGSLECQGNIISPGITEQQLLEACGEPASRDGADWIYKIPGSLPMVVTIGNGVVMFIRDAEGALDSPASPLGDHP